MNKTQAAKQLKISIRSLQRLVQNKQISVTHKRGKSGKQEAIFDADEIETFKVIRDKESKKIATVSTGDKMALARNDANKANQFLQVLRQAITIDTKAAVGVPIADKPLLKLDEAAMLTGLSRDTLRAAINTKELNGKLIGRAFRIKRADLDEFIKNL
jgi:excisionase family DNA binding protein